MSKKKALLITWATHTFHASIAAHLKRLSDSFNITILLVESDFNKGYNVMLEELKASGIIQFYYLIRDVNDAKHVYKSLIGEFQYLRSLNFDMWLTSSNMQIYERYVERFILPDYCLKVVYSDNMTYLLAKPEVVGGLISKSLLSDIRLVRSPVERESYLKKAYAALSQKGLYYLLKKVVGKGRHIVLLVKAMVCSYYSRVFLPFLMFGETFKERQYEILTQMTSGDVDAIILTDPLEVEAHQNLYKHNNVYLVNHGLVGNCRCGQIEIDNRDSILSPLSGLVGKDFVPQSFLDIYLEGFQIALKESGAKKVHLRMHPRETGKWPYQLRDYLIQNDIPATFQDPIKPLQDIICDYKGVAGFASCALRDARAACDYAFVVCFEEVSLVRYANPKLAFGRGEGIGWLKVGSIYDQETFQRNKYKRPDRDLLENILVKKLLDVPREKFDFNKY